MRVPPVDKELPDTRHRRPKTGDGRRETSSRNIIAPDARSMRGSDGAAGSKRPDGWRSSGAGKGMRDGSWQRKAGCNEEGGG